MDTVCKLLLMLRWKLSTTLVEEPETTCKK